MEAGDDGHSHADRERIAAAAVLPDRSSVGAFRITAGGVIGGGAAHDLAAAA